jgi:hypothetical protein
MENTSATLPQYPVVWVPPKHSNVNGHGHDTTGHFEFVGPLPPGVSDPVVRISEFWVDRKTNLAHPHTEEEGKEAGAWSG